MARSIIAFNDFSSLIFNSLKSFNCKQIPTTQFGSVFREFVILKFDESQQSYVLFIKPLTPSSRNPKHEYNFQIIDSQKKKARELAEKISGHCIYAGWAQDKKSILVPAFEKVKKSANQSSIFLSIDRFKKVQDKLDHNVFIRKIAKDENYYSHLFLEKNLGMYFELLNKGRMNPINGAAQEIDVEGFVSFIQPIETLQNTTDWAA